MKLAGHVASERGDAGQPHRSAHAQLRMLRYALRRWPGMLAMLGTMLLAAGVSVLRPWPMKVLVDNVLAGRPIDPAAGFLMALPGAGTRDGLLAWTVGATLAIFMLGWAQSVVSAFARIGFGQRMVYDLATDLFAHLQQLSLRFHSRKSVGDSVRRVVTDSGSVSTIVNDALFPALSSLITLGAVFGVMWSLDPGLSLLALVVVPALMLTLRAYAGPMTERSYAQQEAEGRMYTAVEETLFALPAVQTNSGEARADARLAGATRSILSAALRTTGVQLQFKAVSGLVTALGTAGIMYLGARHALEGSLTAGGIIVFLSYLASLYGPLESIMYASATVQSAMGSARRVMEILDAEQDVKNRPGATPLPRVKGRVRLENVTYGYEPGEPVLREVSLEAQPGEMIALVGHSGAGKSTLVSMVARLADTWQGCVKVDNFDVRDVTVRSLREQVSIVGQETVLMPISIAENIAYGKPGAGIEEIVRAAIAARAHDFIQRLPQGFDTVVGERGATLSGGERQRIGIARAILKNAPILILDEPTSALDAVTEQEVMRSMREVSRGRTTFLIAHRMSTARWADRIAVMSHGRIVEQGSHEALLEKNGMYAALFRAQSDSDVTTHTGERRSTAARNNTARPGGADAANQMDEERSACAAGTDGTQPAKGTGGAESTGGALFAGEAGAPGWAE